MGTQRPAPPCDAVHQSVREDRPCDFLRGIPVDSGGRKNSEPSNRLLGGDDGPSLTLPCGNETRRDARASTGRRRRLKTAGGPPASPLGPCAVAGSPFRNGVVPIEARGGERVRAGPVLDGTPSRPPRFPRLSGARRFGARSAVRLEPEIPG